MSNYRGPEDVFLRYRSHPQAEQVATGQWAFACPRCDSPTWRTFLRYGEALEDGTLVCRRHFTADDRHGLMWCRRCKTMRPAAEFRRDAKNLEFAAAFGVTAADLLLECIGCRNPAPIERACERCGESFQIKRSTARYCSTKCRVAAHRALRLPTARDK